MVKSFGSMQCLFLHLLTSERKDDRDEDIPEPDDDDDEGWKELIKQRFEGRFKKISHQ